MTNLSREKLLPLLYFLSWLPLVSFVFPLPTMEQAEQTGRFVTQKMEASDEVGSKFHLMRSEVKEVYGFYSNPKGLHEWTTLRWGLLVVVLLGGLVASMFVLTNNHFWEMAVISAAGCYLLYTFSRSGFYLTGTLDVRSWLMMSTQLNAGFLVFYKDLIFPVFQCILSVIVFMLFLGKHSSDELMCREPGALADY